ncbi:hypothetical protein BK718_25460 [Bacillus thuringiensis serovar andalousiensis]|uniref:DUF3902 family protein n=1 Tax=Bacillus thuringiensis TaxID=1428 RepID=A0A9X6K9F3_BACTU|nr:MULTISPECIES: DUF3902 family protein [Bacillus cereus group]MDA2615317.1 DUF3902 family protein [Bacillus cereus]MEB8556327.1 DUF3902 family protein [Bacillus cereus]MEB8725398.1 DUF3902 family protein [Bacillus cereus]MEB8976472.1 DUF3902 family protein [Bacillus cereus]MEB9136677.1 DUF3902 family protein [Bacillus cereus]
MKPLLKNIVISFFFAVLGLIEAAVNLNGDWILDWVGVLMAYISLFPLIHLFCKSAYDSNFFKLLTKVTVISFNFAVFGIVAGIVYELLGKWSFYVMMLYWLVVLLLYLTTIIPLFILTLLSRNNIYYTPLYRFIICLNILLTLGPVILSIFLTIRIL